jgi:phosphoenolpyruvate carboxykinase (ATP)
MVDEQSAEREAGHARSPIGLDHLGIRNVNNVYWNLTTPALYEQIIRRREGVIGQLGPIIVRTGAFTGRSPNDKFIVKEPSSEHEISW